MKYVILKMICYSFMTSADMAFLWIKSVKTTQKLSFVNNRVLSFGVGQIYFVSMLLYMEDTKSSDLV